MLLYLDRKRKKFIRENISLKLRKKIVTLVANFLDVRHILYDYFDGFENGEKKIIKSILPTKFKNENLIIFDVGANVGNYTKFIYNLFPKATIYCFEPNLDTFKKLEINIQNIQNIKAINYGVGSAAGKFQIYTSKENDISSHASMLKSVFENEENILSIDTEIITLDEFCLTNNIPYIDFLKIDVEGFELEVLKGAIELIKHNKIKIIQFEFNYMNIESRVFFKDFYKLLFNYDIHRMELDELKLIDEYSYIDEVFYIQNYLAINKSM
jgi:FkbM family methyltransferase